MEKRRLLILGAGDAQLNLVKAAKKLGYYVIVCDQRPYMQASKMADSYYEVNYMDRDSILKVAKKESIDGVISNSEPAMLNVAWLSQELGLPGNSEESIEAFLSKAKFRELQKNAGVFSPKYFLVSSYEELLLKVKEMQFPIIVKPSKSSGTRGTKRFDKIHEMKMLEAFEECKAFSRENLVEIEEYVEMTGLRVNDADIFVVGEDILWDGWLWEDRSKDAPMLPMTEIYPMELEYQKKKQIMDVVESIIRKSGITLGEYNVETYYTKDGHVFVIEINPRQAGNYIPQLIEQHTGVDLTKLLVSTAVNDMSYYKKLKTFERENRYVTLQVVFSKTDGILKDIYIDSELRKYLKWSDQVIKAGELVVQGKNAEDAIAYINFEFDSSENQKKFTDNIEEYVYPIVERDGYE